MALWTCPECGRTVQLFRARKANTIYFNCECGNQAKFREGTEKFKEADSQFGKKE